MQYYIRELCDGRALLIAEDGYPLSTFNTVDDAVAQCITHCRVAPIWIEWFRQSPTFSRDGAAINLAKYRRAEEVFPPLSLARAS